MCWSISSLVRLHCWWHCEVTTVELGSCNRDCRASKDEKIYYAALAKRAFGAPVSPQSWFRPTIQKSGVTPLTWTALRCGFKQIDCDGNCCFFREKVDSQLLFLTVISSHSGFFSLQELGREGSCVYSLNHLPFKLHVQTVDVDPEKLNMYFNALKEPSWRGTPMFERKIESDYFLLPLFFFF